MSDFEMTCTGCDQVKPVEAFYLDRTNMRRWRKCKTCKQNGPAKKREKLEIKSLSREERANLDIKICLNCEMEFKSKGLFNRLCKPCGQLRDD